MFAALAGALVTLGIVTMFLLPDLGDISGWAGGAVFLIFALLLFRTRDVSQQSQSAETGLRGEHDE